MPERTDVIYLTDGSFAGALCCVFDSYVQRELPQEILTEEQPSFFRLHRVKTDPAHAARIMRSLEQRSGELARWVQTAWFSCAPDCSFLLYRFIRLAYQYGAQVTTMLQNSIVNRMWRLVRQVENEAHLTLEFLRFSEYQGMLAAVIEPKCIVLPLIQAHFADRYPEETFLIYDQAHKMALVYRPYEARILPVEGFLPPAADERERQLRALWGRYHRAIAIEGRSNPKCQISHMPKRFWGLLPEMLPLGLERGRAAPMLGGVTQTEHGE